MKCPKCQLENPEGSSFCRGCGHSLQAELVCAQCGHENLPGSGFGNKCGRSLTGEVTAATSIQSLEPNNFALNRLRWLDQEITKYRDYKCKAASFHAAFFTALLFILLDAQRRILLTC